MFYQLKNPTHKKKAALNLISMTKGGASRAMRQLHPCPRSAVGRARSIDPLTVLMLGLPLVWIGMVLVRIGIQMVEFWPF